MTVLLSCSSCWIVYMWSLTGAMQSQLFDIPRNLCGLVALCAIDLLFVSSLSFVRNRLYTLFFGIHVTSITVFLYAVRHFFVFFFFNTDQPSDVQARSRLFPLCTNRGGPLRLRSPCPHCPDTVYHRMADCRACSKWRNNARPCSFPSSRLASWPARPRSCCQQRLVWVVGDLVPVSCSTVHHRRGIRLWWYDAPDQGYGLLDSQLATLGWRSRRRTARTGVY